MSTTGLTRNPSYTYTVNPYGDTVSIDRLLEVLPPLLDSQARQAIAGVSSKRYFASTEDRIYRYGERDFVVPCEVAFPGEISGFLFDKIWTGEIDLVGKNFLSMGVGAGVEIVLAAERGATAVTGADIDTASVRASRENYERNRATGNALTTFVASDLFAAIPSQQFDVICFNGPFGVPVVDDERLGRIAYAGPAIFREFLLQLTSGNYLSHDGSIYIVCSNTTDMRALVACAREFEFKSQVLESITAPPGHAYENIVTHYFRFSQVH